MSRKRFTERQVIEALIRTGHEIRCYRTKEVITLETVKRLEREHVTPLKLGGADDPTNAAYSLSEAHKAQTKKDIAAIAKVARLRNPKPSRHPMKSSGRKIPSRTFPKRKAA